MYQGLIEDIHGLLPRISEHRIYKVLCSIKGRYNKYGKLGLGKRDGPKFGISERQMPKLINLLLDYGFLIINGEVSHTKRGFKCRLFKMSAEFKAIVYSIKDFVKKVFKYINPTEFVKANFTYKIVSGNIVFKIGGEKHIIHKRGRFKDVIYSTIENKIINPQKLI